MAAHLQAVGVPGVCCGAVGIHRAEALRGSCGADASQQVQRLALRVQSLSQSYSSLGDRCLAPSTVQHKRQQGSRDSILVCRQFVANGKVILSSSTCAGQSEQRSMQDPHLLDLMAQTADQQATG